MGHPPAPSLEDGSDLKLREKKKRRLKPGFWEDTEGREIEGQVCLACRWQIPYDGKDDYFDRVKKAFDQHNCEDFEPR